jgi:chorismate mutase
MVANGGRVRDLFNYLAMQCVQFVAVAAAEQSIDDVLMFNNNQTCLTEIHDIYD